MRDYLKWMRASLVVTPLSLIMLAMYTSSASPQQSQYPIMEKVAQKVIEKYHTSSCEDLRAQKAHPPDPQQAAMMQKAVGMLRSDPQMRQQFLNKVAPTIANKMFECGMIP